MLTLPRCPFHPRVTAVARKRPRSFYHKCSWQVTPKHAYTFDQTMSERTKPLCGHSVGTYQETSSHATRQATLGYSRLSSRDNLHFKKKKKLRRNMNGRKHLPSLGAGAGYDVTRRGKNRRRADQSSQLGTGAGYDVTKHGRGERKHVALRPQKPLRLIRDGEVGGSGI